MAAKQANTAQRKWMDDITEWANENITLLFPREFCSTGFQRHHVTGRASRQNKVAIGHWFIIPVPWRLHDVNSNDQLNVTHRKKPFTSRFGMQREIFKTMYESMKEQGYTMPSDEVFNAIMSTCE